MQPVPRICCALVLAALLGFGGVAAQQQQIRLDCDSEAELDQVMDYVHTVCKESHEAFLDAYDKVPSTCRTEVCAAAVGRAAQSCGQLLSGSVWFKTWRDLLEAAVATCALVPKLERRLFTAQ